MASAGCWADSAGLEIAFLPTAICENGCGAISRRSGKTNARGTGKLRVRVPGTFIGKSGRHIYFRDGERIDLEAFRNGAHRTFDVASANPDPDLCAYSWTS